MMQVVAHTEGVSQNLTTIPAKTISDGQVDLSSETRVMTLSRDAKTWELRMAKGVQCLTVSNPILLHSKVFFAPCIEEKGPAPGTMGALENTGSAPDLSSLALYSPTTRISRNQAFRTVRGLSGASHPRSTVGRLVLSDQPEYCISREAENKPMTNSFVPKKDGLYLDLCDAKLTIAVMFEFESVR